MNWIVIAQKGFDNWAAKPHNAKWFRRIDGTPIPNDLVVCIGEAFAPYLAPATQAVPVSAAIADIAAERQRQISAEGWSFEHDDQHDQGELAEAASCYARGSDRVTWMQPDPEFLRRKVMTGRIIWPWSPEWWKPKDRRRDLVRAGALILAEIERLDRLATKVPA